MDSASSKSVSTPTSRETGGLSYRCVCGSDVLVSTVAGGNCTTCGRHYNSRILDSVSADTYTFYGSTAVPLDSSEPHEDPLLGKRFGHYRVIERIGSGGMGAVYRALDESLQRYVALKVLRMGVGTSGADSGHVERLLQEAIAQARVNHPHVVHIYFVGHQDELPFLAMELVPGNTVAQMLETGPLPFPQVVAIASQITAALGHCASFDIVHGDIKPSNMLAASSLTVKLADFGLAQRMSLTQSSNNKIAGTPNYLAPELANGSAANTQSDMYSLGVTLFEMTFRRLPYTFSGQAIEDRIRAHQEDPIEFPDDWPDEIPSEWRELLARLMAKNPAERYQSYLDLQSDLERIRPKELLSAGTVPRFLAALVDLFATLLVATLVSIPVISLAYALSLGWRLAGACTASLTVAGLCWGIARWRTSPGKMLFQLRVVNQHGLSPSRKILCSRLPFQILPMCGLVAFDIMGALGFYFAGASLLVLSIVAFLIDGAFVLFSQQGRSLHDRFFHTQVTIDTGN